MYRWFITVLEVSCWTINDTSNIVINRLYIVLDLVLYTWIRTTNTVWKISKLIYVAQDMNNFYDPGNEPLGSITYGEFLGQLKNS
jgi:hypothetical protein